MTKLTKDVDVEIQTADQRLKLTASGVAKLGLAVATAPALWAIIWPRTMESCTWKGK